MCFESMAHLERSAQDEPGREPPFISVQPTSLPITPVSSPLILLNNPDYSL